MFGHDSQPSRVYSYGTREPVDGADLVGQQMRDAHRYRNVLVEMERERRSRVEAALLELSPDLVAVEEEIRQWDQVLDAARDCIRRTNARARKRVGCEVCSAAAKDARDALRPLRARRKELRVELFSSERWAERQAAIGAWATAEQKRLRAEWSDRIAWGSRAVVEQSISRSGPPPRFRRWTGDGHLAIQIQGGMGVADTCDTRIRIMPAEGPGTSRHNQYRVWLRVGSEGKANRIPVWAVIPVVLHRPLPSHARIKWVHLVRRRIATHFEWRLQFVLASTEEAWRKDDLATEGMVGIDVGWRMMPDGSLRVAAWHDDSGASGELSLSPRWLEGMRQTRDLRSIRDMHFNAATKALREWLAVPGNNRSWLPERTQHLAQWRSPARLASLVAYWKQNRLGGNRDPWDLIRRWKRDRGHRVMSWRSLTDGVQSMHRWLHDASLQGDDEILLTLEMWRQRDKHLYEWENNQRHQLQGQRLDLYRNFAATMRRHYHTAIIEQLDLRDFHVLPEAEEEAVEGALREHTRDAALSVLLGTLRQEMAEVIEIDQVEHPSTIPCHVCGAVQEWDRRELWHTCDGCGAEWDQDANAARNLLASAEVAQAAG